MLPNANTQAVRASSTSVAISSTCSDLRELNEAKVQGILNYLEDIDRPPVMCATYQFAQQQYHSTTMDQGGSLASPTTNFQPISLAQLSQGGPAPVTSSPPLSTSEQMALQNLNGSLCSTGKAVAYLPMNSASQCGGRVFGAAVESNSVYQGIKGRMDSLKTETDEKSKIIDSLKTKLSELQEKSDTEHKKFAQEKEKELAGQKKTLEGTMQKHLTSMSQLLNDKEQLTRRCEMLSQQLSSFEQTKDAEIQKLKTANATAINEMKNKWQLVEKQKREAWAQKESKKIKETTLRAMEPDIALLMNRHKAEKRQLEEEHRDALKRKDETIENKEKQITDLKLRLTSETEELLQKERESYRARLSEESERMHRLLEDERRFSLEKREALEKFNNEQKEDVRKEMKALEQHIFVLKANETEITNKVQQTILAEVEKIKNMKDAEILSLKSQLFEAHKNWEEKTDHCNKLFLEEKESEIRKRCTLERDTAISKVISQLEEDYLKELNTQKEKEKTLREKVSILERDVEKYQVELRLISDQRNNAMKSIQSKEEEATYLKQEIMSLREHLHHSEAQMNHEFEQRLKKLDSQWREKLHYLEDSKVREFEQKDCELQNVTRQLELLRSESEATLRAMEQRQNMELSAINDRVLTTLSKKEQMIRQLNDQCHQLEMTLQDRNAELEKHKELLTQY